MNNLPDERGGCRLALLLCRWGVLSLALVFAGLTPLRAAEAPEPLTPCTAEPTDMIMDYGMVIDCAIDVVGDSDVFRFPGIANTVVVISIHDPTTNPWGQCVDGMYAVPHPVLELFAPADVKPIATIGGGKACGYYSEVLLPVDGIYTLRVSEKGDDQTEKYRLGVERLLPSSPTSQPISFGTDTGSKSISPVLDQDLYTFTAYKSAAISITLGDSPGCGPSGMTIYPCPHLRLFGPDQVLVDKVGPGAMSKNIILPLEGIYTIRVFEEGNDQTENYGLTLQCLSPPTGQSSCGPLQSAVTVELTSSANPALLGQPIIFTGAVRNAKNPTGKLNFSVDGSALAPCTDMPLTNASANCTASGLSVGNHAIMARYSGDSTNNSAQATLTQVVQAPPPNSYPLKVTRAPTGIVTSEPAGINCGAKNKLCTGAYSQVTLTAAPVPGYGFKQWVGCSQPTGNTCTMTLTQATKIKASFFKLPKYALKLTKTRLGKVSSSPPGLLCNVAKTRTCRGLFTSGTKVILTAEPLPGFSFIGWSGDCSGTKTCELIMNGKKSVGATFQ